MARGEGRRICFFHRRGEARSACPRRSPPAPEKLAFLKPYGRPAELLPDLCRFAADENCGDLILFGAYDGEQIVCFDDQVGGHGSVGGEQLRPFLILPRGAPPAGARGT